LKLGTGPRADLPGQPTPEQSTGVAEGNARGLAAGPARRGWHWRSRWLSRRGPPRAAAADENLARGEGSGRRAPPPPPWYSSGVRSTIVAKIYCSGIAVFACGAVSVAGGPGGGTELTGNSSRPALRAEDGLGLGPIAGLDAGGMTGGKRPRDHHGLLGVFRFSSRPCCLHVGQRSWPRQRSGGKTFDPGGRSKSPGSAQMHLGQFVLAGKGPRVTKR